MALLPKGGLKLGGHKVPWEAVGAVAAVVGVILIIRARQQGGNVASVGTPPGSVGGAAFGASGFGPDYSGALANISQELTVLQQQGINATPTTPAPTPAPVPTRTAIPWGRIPGIGVPGVVEGDPNQRPIGTWPFGRI